MDNDNNNDDDEEEDDVESAAKQMPEFTLIRSRLFRRIIKSLKPNTASGPDGVPTRVFQ